MCDMSVVWECMWLESECVLLVRGERRGPSMCDGWMAWFGGTLIFSFLLHRYQPALLRRCYRTLFAITKVSGTRYDVAGTCVMVMWQARVSWWCGRHVCHRVSVPGVRYACFMPQCGLWKGNRETWEKERRSCRRLSSLLLLGVRGYSLLAAHHGVSTVAAQPWWWGAPTRTFSFITGLSSNDFVLLHFSYEAVGFYNHNNVLIRGLEAYTVRARPDPRHTPHGQPFVVRFGPNLFPSWHHSQRLHGIIGRGCMGP